MRRHLSDAFDGAASQIPFDGIHILRSDQLRMIDFELFPVRRMENKLPGEIQIFPFFYELKNAYTDCFASIFFGAQHRVAVVLIPIYDSFHIGFKSFHTEKYFITLRRFYLYLQPVFLLNALFRFPFFNGNTDSA